jgi:hypothetical protein
MTGLGVLLILVTCGVAIAIGLRANRSVKNFNPSQHEIFLGSKK